MWLFLQRRRAFRHERSSVQQSMSRLRAKQPRREAAGGMAERMLPLISSIVFLDAFMPETARRGSTSIRNAARPRLR